MVDHRGAPKVTGDTRQSPGNDLQGAVAPQGKRKFITTGTMIPDAEMTSRHNHHAIHERRVGTTRYSFPKPITIYRI